MWNNILTPRFKTKISDKERRNSKHFYQYNLISIEASECVVWQIKQHKPSNLVYLQQSRCIICLQI